MARGKVTRAETQGRRGVAKMKPSGVAWLGDIPEGWEVVLAKALFKQEKRPTRPEDEIITAFRDGQVTLRKNRRTTGFTEATNYDTYQGIRKGDLVIHQMDAFAGCAGISDSDGMGSPILIACTPRRDDVKPRYYAEIVRIMGHSGFISALAKGVRERSADFRFETFAKQLFPLPPLPEQRAIADYLDEKCGAIDAAITEAKKGIEEYKALKKSLIFEAVTGKRRVGAFNAETQSCREAEKMKPSGIPWIGEIPEGWRVNKGRFIYDIATGKKDVNAEAPDGQYMFFTCSKTAKRIATYSFDCEALLVAGNGEVGFTQYYKGKFDAYQRTYVISGFRGVAPLFLRYYMSGLLPLQAQYNSVGSVIEFIKLGDLKGFVVTLPSLPEQQVIADYLDEKCTAIDAVVAEKEALIADLEAYKKSLIYETVTG